jgi:hypothetical protein
LLRAVNSVRDIAGLLNKGIRSIEVLALIKVLETMNNDDYRHLEISIAIKCSFLGQDKDADQIEN